MARLLAVKALQQDTGRYGESLIEAHSEKASPGYYGPGAVRFIATHLVNEAEAAVERYRAGHKDDLPAGASFFVERKTYD